MVSDVTERKGAEQGVAQGVDQHVAVGVARRALLVGYLDAADPEGGWWNRQWPSRCKLSFDTRAQAEELTRLFVRMSKIEEAPPAQARALGSTASRGCSSRSRRKGR